MVLGIITTLIAILLPSIAAARGQARSVACQGNVRQICQALFAYAAEYEGQLPPNTTSPAPGLNWFDPQRAGKFLTGAAGGPAAGGVLACPADQDGARSYSMVIWASSKTDTSVAASAAGPPQRATFWSLRNSSDPRLMIVAESWTTQRSGPLWCAPATIGYAGATPGQRFGAGSGISPPLNAGRWGRVTSELPYVRHRSPAGGAATAAVGRVVIGYGDGHVAMKSNADLANDADGTSTLDSLWSPFDLKTND